MKEKWKYKKLFFIILILVVVSLGATAVIVMRIINNTEMESDAKAEEYWFFNKSIQTGQTIELKNAYISTNVDGQLEFVYEDAVYVIAGVLERDYAGVADVVVDGKKIKSVYVKSNSSIGIIQSYDENTIVLKDEEGTKRLSKGKELPIYKCFDDKVLQGNWNDMIVGTSQIECIIENEEVTAVLVKQSVPSDISVIIKNGNTIFYEELYIKKESNQEHLDVNVILTAQGTEELVVKDEIGLFLCDAHGNNLGDIYEGEFRVVKTEDGLVLVNTLPIETYVKYVLPSEMPTRFHEEALKAQAVCARTFAYDQMKNQSYAMYGANLDDSTSFQVYHSTGRFAEADAAVDATKGEIITCNGDLITCYYFSTSAGKTNDMSVWGSQTPEYIMPCESYDTDSPFYQWKAYLDTTIIQENENGELNSIEVMAVNSSGYVTELKMIYNNKMIFITNENDIRKALGKYLQETVLKDGRVRTDLSMIPSANFSILEEKDGQIVLVGGGFGHGIGMSQYGADQMAKNGFGYKAIIEHYFKNVVVKSA